MQLVTLLELKDRAREAADQENSTFVSDKELVKYINSSLQKLYDLIVAAYGQEYYQEEVVLTLVPSKDRYSLPDNFYKLMGVDLMLSPNPDFKTNAITLKPYMYQERNRYVNSYLTADNVDGTIRMRYRLKGNDIHLIPQPSGFNSLRIHYIPVMEKLVGDSDEFDGVNGWEEYAVLNAAIKMVRKEEGDLSDLKADRKDIEDKLVSMARDRDMGMPMRVTDIAIEDFDLYDGAY